MTVRAWCGIRKISGHNWRASAFVCVGGPANNAQPASTKTGGMLGGTIGREWSGKSGGRRRNEERPVGALVADAVC